MVAGNSEPHTNNLWLALVMVRDRQLSSVVSSLALLLLLLPKFLYLDPSHLLTQGTLKPGIVGGHFRFRVG